MIKIEEGLHNIHGLAGNQVESSGTTASEIPDYTHLEPFLKVNLVSPASPAETAVRNMILCYLCIIRKS